MTLSYTLSGTTSFTATHARHIAAKVATDLKRIQRFYGSPSNASIEAYEVELTLLLKGGYLDTVIYGFQRNGSWIEPTLIYTARDLAGSTAADDDPGRILPGADIDNACFYSYMIYSNSWTNLPETERISFEKQLPFQRTGAPEPAISGYRQIDRSYSAGGRALERASVRSF